MSRTEIIGEEAKAPIRSRSRVERLYRLHSPWLTARIRRRFGRDAEDVVQEAWLWLIPLSASETIRSPKALLLRIASNIAITRARQTRRRAELLAHHAPQTTSTYGADQSEAVLLQQIVLGLPQPLRDVFVLSRIGGLSNGQIAEHLGVSPKTVEWRMTKALAYCAAQLRR